MKKIALLFVALACMVGTQAQSRFTATSEKSELVNNPDVDLHTLVGKHSDLQTYVANGNYKEAYACWSYLFRRAPLYDLDLYTLGRTMFRGILTAQEDYADESLKMEAYRDMITMYNTRIANIDDLNALYGYRFNDNVPTRGDIQVMFEIDRYELGKQVGRDSLNLSYQRFHNAMQVVKTYGGRDLDAAFLSHFISMSHDMCKNNPQRYDYVVQFLDDYSMCYNLCDSLLNEARAEQTTNFGDLTERAQAVLDRYNQANINIEVRFRQVMDSTIQTSMLQQAFDHVIELNRSNEAYLRNIITVMLRSQRDTLPAFYKAGEYAHQMRHSYESCVALGFKAMRAHDRVGASNYLVEAMGYANNDEERGALAMMAARGMLVGGDYPAARVYLTMATQYSGMLEGQCEFLRAKTYFYEGLNCLKVRPQQPMGAWEKYNQAYNCCIVAKDLDATLVAQVDEFLGNENSGLISRKMQMDEWRSEYLAGNRRVDAAAQAEYERRQRSIQEEEAFWGNNRR